MRTPVEAKSPAVSLALFGLVFVSLAALTWRKWPDIVVDFGHQLYIPWQLSAGKILYLDIAYVFGPLSQYFHAGLFRLFGPSFTVLIAADLALIAVETWLLYSIFREAADEVAARVAGLCFLAAFGFAQIIPNGNYNFAAPFAHEATHGIILTTLMVFALLRAAQRRSGRWAVAAGLALGATCLTKPEVSVAALATALAWVAMEIRLAAGSRGRALGRTLQFGAGATLALGLGWACVGLFAGRAALAEAFFGYWRLALDRRVFDMPFYRAGMGLDRPVLNVAFMLLVSAVLALAAWVIYRLAILRGRGYLALYAVALLLPWGLAGACLLPAVLYILFKALSALRSNSPRGDEPAARIWVLWSVFALALLPKMLLAPRIFHYGFYLGMPGFLLVAVYLTHHLPESLPLPVPSKLLFRSLMAEFLLLGMLRLTLTSQFFFYARKTAAIGRAGDRIRVFDSRLDPRTGAVQGLLGEIERTTKPGATLAVFPEGVMLNYLSRRANPSRYINFAPLVLHAYGEASVLADLERKPPDYVILFHRDTTEFGAGLFGRDPSYGRRILEWIERDYIAVWQTGSPPLQEPAQFGAKLLKRRSESLSKRLPDGVY